MLNRTQGGQHNTDRYLVNSVFVYYIILCFITANILRPMYDLMESTFHYHSLEKCHTYIRSSVA